MNQNDNDEREIKLHVKTPEEIRIERIIKHYDLDLLKKEIVHHEANILIFEKAIQDAKEKIEELKAYIKIIEAARNGDRV